jgi:nucleoid-associated protein YgaU
MNNSYSIALCVAVALCGTILGYHFWNAGDAQPIVDSNAMNDNPSGQVTDSSRPTLRSDSVPPPPPQTGLIPVPPPADSNPPIALDHRGDTQAPPRVDVPSVAVVDPQPPVQTPAATADARPSPTAGQSTTPSASTNPHNIPRTGRESLVHNTPVEGPTYTIQPGDTFSSIAREKLGSESKYHLIAEANPMVDPSRLKVGLVIRLPHPDHPQNNPPVPAGSTPARSTAGAGPAEYTVQSGDTLSRIARVHYGDPNLWEVIYLANKAKIGSNPANLKVGMKLFIPPEPRAAH